MAKTKTTKAKAKTPADAPATIVVPNPERLSSRAKMILVMISSGCEMGAGILEGQDADNVGWDDEIAEYLRDTEAAITGILSRH